MPHPSTLRSRQHFDGAAAGPLRGPDAERRSADTGSLSPGLLPDGCKQVHRTDVETEAQRGGVTRRRPGTSKAGAESDLRTREDGAGSTGEAQTEGAETERVLYPRGSTRAPRGAELHQSRGAGPQAVSAERSRDGLWGQPTTYRRNRTPFSQGGQRSRGTPSLPLRLWGRSLCLFQVPLLHLPFTAKLATPLCEIERKSMETLGGSTGLNTLSSFHEIRPTTSCSVTPFSYEVLPRKMKTRASSYIKICAVIPPPPEHATKATRVPKRAPTPPRRRGRAPREGVQHPEHPLPPSPISAKLGS